MANRKKRSFFRNRGSVPQQAIIAGSPSHYVPMLQRMLQASIMGYGRRYKGFRG